MLQHLKRNGVMDPNLDLWLSVTGRDTAGVETALKSGATVDIESGTVLAAHRALLDDFDPAQWGLAMRTTPPGAFNSAHCWACVLGLALVSSSTGDPVGVCRDCGVLGCVGHGSVDRLSGLWVCHKSVVKQAAAGAGVPTYGSQASPLQIGNRSDLRDRFATLVEAASPFLSVERLDARSIQASLGTDVGPVDQELLQDAVAIATFLTRGMQTSERRGAVRTTAIFGPVDQLIGWSSGG